MMFKENCLSVVIYIKVKLFYSFSINCKQLLIVCPDFFFYQFLLFKGFISGQYNPFYINPKDFWDQQQLAIGTEEDVHIRREVIALYMNALCGLNSCDYMSVRK